MFHYFNLQHFLAIYRTRIRMLLLTFITCIEFLLRKMVPSSYGWFTIRLDLLRNKKSATAFIISINSIHLFSLIFIHRTVFTAKHLLWNTDYFLSYHNERGGVKWNGEHYKYLIWTFTNKIQQNLKGKTHYKTIKNKITTREKKI